MFNRRQNVLGCKPPDKPRRRCGLLSLGLFDVNMPLVYGERIKAFRRLQEEIVKRSNDMTIFAWDGQIQSDRTVVGIFADSPAAFAGSALTSTVSHISAEFSVTNKGLLVSSHIPLRIQGPKAYGSEGVDHYVLCLGGEPAGMQVCIPLFKLEPNLFARSNQGPRLRLARTDIEVMPVAERANYYILTDGTPAARWNTAGFVQGALSVHPYSTNVVLQDTAPVRLWDAPGYLFLKPEPWEHSRYPMVLACRFDCAAGESSLDLVVLCDYRAGMNHPSCKIFRWKDYEKEAEFIFSNERNKTETVFWVDLAMHAPSLCELEESITIKRARNIYKASATFVKGEREVFGSRVELFSLRLEVRKETKKKRES